MPDHNADPRRRNFIKLGVMGLVATPLVNLSINSTVQAAAAKQRSSEKVPALSEDDPQAIALGYQENATSVDTAKYQRKSDQFCHNCQLYTGQPEARWGPCAIFSYRIDPKTNSPLVVSANGWCRGWGPRAG